jgi:hypothetical protein
LNNIVPWFYEQNVIREPLLLYAAHSKWRESMTPDEIHTHLEQEGACLVIAGNRPCKFLGEDSLCSIYPTRPNACVGMQAGDEQRQSARAELGLTASCTSTTRTLIGGGCGPWHKQLKVLKAVFLNERRWGTTTNANATKRGVWAGIIIGMVLSYCGRAVSIRSRTLPTGTTNRRTGPDVNVLQFLGCLSTTRSKANVEKEIRSR